DGGDALRQLLGSEGAGGVLHGGVRTGGGPGVDGRGCAGGGGGVRAAAAPRLIPPPPPLPVPVPRGLCPRTGYASVPADVPDADPRLAQPRPRPPLVVGAQGQSGQYGDA